jgi:hypothetical protein
VKIFKFTILCFMVVIFSDVSLAKGGGGSAGGSSGSSSGSGSSGAGNSTSDIKRDQTRVPAADQSGTKKQDRDRVHTPGTGTSTPAPVPAAN